MICAHSTYRHSLTLALALTSHVCTVWTLIWALLVSLEILSGCNLASEVVVVVAEVVDSISSSRSNSCSSSQACAQVFFRWAIVPNLFLGVWELQSKESHSSNHFLWFQSVAKVFAWMIGSIYQYNFPPKNAFITHSCQSVFDTAQESRACFHHWECGQTLQNI